MQDNYLKMETEKENPHTSEIDLCSICLLYTSRVGLRQIHHRQADRRAGKADRRNHPV